MSQIINAVPKEDYCLDIILYNGSNIHLSLKSRLETIRFGMHEIVDGRNRL